MENIPRAVDVGCLAEAARGDRGTKHRGLVNRKLKKACSFKEKRNKCRALRCTLGFAPVEDRGLVKVNSWDRQKTDSLPNLSVVWELPASCS